MSESDENKQEDLMEGRYRILGTIGEGGVGVVYKAQDTLLDKVVAIKKIQSKSSGNEIVRFQKEARVGGALVHPNILGVIDFGLTKENEFYLVLNFIQGESLSELLQRSGPVPLFEALDIFIQIARGLAHAHKNKVIHRDIKPSNVMLVDDGAGGINVQIVDFGLAKSLEMDQSLTKSGVGIGTPRYMSPEQIRGERGIGPAADVYSMGCLMFEVLTGRPAFRGDNVMETLHQHLSSEIPDLNAVSELRFPPAMVEIVRKCLNKGADARYASGEELLEQLDQLLEHLQTSSGEPIDSSKLSPKTEATRGDATGNSEEVSTGSKTRAMLRRTIPVFGTIAVFSLICLLFTLPIFSKLFVTRLTPMKPPPFGSSMRWNAQDNRKIERSIGSLNSSVDNLSDIDSSISRKLAETDLDRDDLTKEITIDKSMIPSKIRKVFFDEKPEGLHDSNRVTMSIADGHTEVVSGIEDPYKALNPLSSFHRDPKIHGRLDAITPKFSDFEALRSFYGDHSVTGIRISGSINLSPGAIPYLIPLKPTYFRMDDSVISSQAFAEIEKLSSIRQLVLSNVTVRPPRYETIGKLKNLQLLELHEMALSDDLLAAVGELSQLKELFIHRPKVITDKGFVNLIKLSKLKKLHLLEMDLNDTQMGVLRNLRHLENIVLSKSEVSSTGLRSLESMNWLKRINVSGSPTLTWADVYHLSKALPNTDIIDRHMPLYRSGDSSVGHRGKIPRKSPDKNESPVPSPGNVPIALSKLGSDKFEFDARSQKYWSVGVTDDGLKELVAESGPRIHKIQFRSGRVTASGYALLKKSPLTYLEFYDTRISGDILKAIGNLPHVRTVVFKTCPEIDFSHMTELNRLKDFHELIIEESNLSKSDFTNIAKVRSIEQLKLDYCKGLTPDNLAPLTSIPRLGSLHMVATDFFDPGFEVLKRLPLGNLVISNTPVTTYGLESYLRSGSGHIYIELSLSKLLTADDMKKLRQIRPNARLRVVDPKMDTDYILNLN